MNKRLYVNTGYIIGILGALFISLLFVFLMSMILDNPTWVTLGAYLWFFIFVFLILTRGSPVILAIYEDKTIKFVGVPWRYILKRNWVDKVVIEPTGIIFKPKEENQNEFRWVPNSPMDIYKGYKVIKFANYRAIGELIENLQPITGIESWDKLNPKRRRYLEEKLYNASVEDDGKR